MSKLGRVCFTVQDTIKALVLSGLSKEEAIAKVERILRVKFDENMLAKIKEEK